MMTLFLNGTLQSTLVLSLCLRSRELICAREEVTVPTQCWTNESLLSRYTQLMATLEFYYLLLSVLNFLYYFLIRAITYIL